MICFSLCIFLKVKSGQVLRTILFEKSATYTNGMPSCGVSVDDDDEMKSFFNGSS